MDASMPAGGGLTTLEGNIKMDAEAFVLIITAYATFDTAAQIATCQAAVNTALPRTAAFNGLAGSKQPTVFNQLNTTAAAGSLQNATNLLLIQQLLAGSLAQTLS